ncbi:peroxide stress protein YaaA [Clostridium sp. 19966]|uniref:peroxide stress protein YaaA n=1 Tax=Clostridium sp. 19966 TaxID=2768166 RepID=UPI0028DDED8A|nr:peroxide stress protein YaaA [Clostridium sp. 19966]MDT8717909.1 peroxide stress protein YaaA [Clostridium sp. 19966]
MLMILSPAKTLNFEKVHSQLSYTTPRFVKEASQVMKELKKYSPPELESLMKINSKLSELNFKRNLAWSKEHSLENSKQALFCFDGAVYHGFAADSLKEEHIAFAQQHVRILSGLYGMLRPLDLIEPYRLEMGIKLPVKNNNNLYEFWKDALLEYFNKEMKLQKEQVLVNLASKEYYSAIDMKKLGGKVVTPIFKDYNHGKYKIVAIYAKRARGLMARYISENKIESAEELKNFDLEGYEFDEKLSDDENLIFTRVSRF